MHKRVLFVHMVWSRVKKLYWVKFGKHCIKTLIEILSRLWGDIGFSFLQFLKKIFQLFYYKHVFLASLTQWTWVGVNSGRQWRTGKPDVLPSMGSQGAGHDWATEQQQHFLMMKKSFFKKYHKENVSDNVVVPVRLLDVRLQSQSVTYAEQGLRKLCHCHLVKTQGL